MSIDQFIPTLQPMVEQVNTDLRFICYFVLTASIIFRAAQARTGSVSGLMRPIVTATVITGLIATLPFWFNLVKDEFWAIAMQIRSQYAGDIASTGAELLQRLKPSDDGINWLDVTDSLMKAVQYAIGWVIVFLGAIIQIPMLFVQYVMECLCYLFLPIALSLFALESTKGLAIRYVQQTLAVLAWPIGFAVVDMVGYSLLTSVPSLVNAATAGTQSTPQFTPNNFMMSGLVAVWLILGSLGTPIVMQLLFCSGSPLSTSVGQSIQMGLAALGIAQLAAGGGSSGGSAPTSKPNTPDSGADSGSSSSAPGGGDGGGGSGGELPGSAHPQLPPSSSPAVAGRSRAPATSPGGPGAALPPHGYTLPPAEPPTYDLELDPTGEFYAVNLMNLNQTPQSVSY